jgi:hypothetical protein
MPATIYFRVGEKDEITLEEFLSAGQHFLKLLCELDAAISETPSGSVRWTVSFLSKNSPPEIGVTAQRRPKRDDRSSEIQRAIVAGSLALSDRGERPPEFSDAALAILQRIANKSATLGPSLIYTREKGQLQEQGTKINLATAQKLQEFTAPRCKAWGTLTGRLDTITVRKGTEFRIIDEETKSPVRCKFNNDQLEHVKALLGRRIVASGTIHANSSGAPIRLIVEGEIQSIETTELPTIDQMIGLVPDLTGELTLLEFLEADDADDESDLLGH